MGWKFWIQLISITLLILLSLSFFVARRAQEREQIALQLQLKSAQNELARVNARETARNAALEQQLAQLEKKKAALKQPADLLKALPEVLPLPKPLTLEEPVLEDNQPTPPSKPDSPGPKVLLPIEDLKALYDTAVDCKECQARLAAAQADLQDEHAKTATVSRELADALRTAKGGSVLARVSRAAKWFLIGAAAGAAAAKFAR